MECTLALLADYANVTREGKLNLLGIFDRISVTSLPAVHRELQLVLVLEAQFIEIGREQSIEIKLHEPDGPVIFSIGGSIAIQSGKAGEVSTFNHMITIGNLPLRKVGVHTFAIFVNNDLKRQIPLRVVEVPQQPEQPRIPGT